MTSLSRSLIWGDSFQVQIEKRKLTVVCSCSPQNSLFDHLTLLFCSEQQRNVKSTCRHCFCSLERFSFGCRKTKTKVITLTNHNSRKQSNEPIRARSKYMLPVPSAGKRVRVSHDWFWFYFWLVEKVARDFFSQSQSVAMQNQSNCGITFDTQLKSALHLLFCAVLAASVVVATQAP